MSRLETNELECDKERSCFLPLVSSKFDQRLLPLIEGREGLGCKAEKDGRDRTRGLSLSSISGEALGSKSPVHGLFHIIELLSDSTRSSSFASTCRLVEPDLSRLNNDVFVCGFDRRLELRRSCRISLDGRFPMVPRSEEKQPRPRHDCECCAR